MDKDEKNPADRDETPPANINSDVRKAQLVARQKEEAKVAAEAWAEHVGHDQVRDEKTAGLKAQRMARDAKVAPAPPKPKPKPKPKPRKRAMARARPRS